MSKEKMYMIIQREKFLETFTYSIHKSKMYDLTTAVKKLLALDTLIEDKERYSYHLQEVSFSDVQEPLELTEDMEVKQEQSEMPF